MSGPDDPDLLGLMHPETAKRWRDDVELVEAAGGKFDLEAFRHGALTPVYFGSALRNFGVRTLLDALIAHAPPPRPQKSAAREIQPDEPAMTGIVFKIQANMDPNHRDRMAFMRVCSGVLTRGMKVKHVRTGRTMALVRRRNSSSRKTARSPRKPSREMSLAFPIAELCGLAML